MKILALSDQRVEALHSPAVRDRFKDVELIVSCGDLNSSYLEYIVTMLGVPMVYVPGNHDPDRYAVPGGIDVDGKCISIRGLSVAGLGGSIRYKPQGRHQYTQVQTYLRALGLLLQLAVRPRQFTRGIDLLITHAPPFGIHHEEDWAHTGFRAYHPLLRITRPRMLLHGHSHILRGLHTTQTTVYGSRVINVYPYRELVLE